jgi:hypothetical protein
VKAGIEVSQYEIGVDGRIIIIPGRARAALIGTDNELTADYELQQWRWKKRKKNAG